MTCDLRNIGVRCVKREDVKDALEKRESIKVDPFGTGFGHKQGHAFVLNKFRLAFQVFLKPEGDQGPTIVVKDVAVSQVVADSKACGDLKIVDYSDNTSPFVGKLIFFCTKSSNRVKLSIVFTGGKKIMLFTEKVKKDDIEVHFSYCDPTGNL